MWVRPASKGQHEIVVSASQWMSDRELDADVTEALAALANSIADAAPKGWRRATMSATVGDGWSSVSGAAYEPEEISSYTEGLDMHEGLQEVCREADPWERLTIELVVHSSGEFEAVTSEALERPAFGYLFVREAEDLPPEPGTLQPGPQNAVPAGDSSIQIAVARGRLPRLTERDLANTIPLLRAGGFVVRVAPGGVVALRGGTTIRFDAVPRDQVGLRSVGMSLNRSVANRHVERIGRSTLVVGPGPRAAWTFEASRPLASAR